MRFKLGERQKNTVKICKENDAIFCGNAHSSVEKEPLEALLPDVLMVHLGANRWEVEITSLS